MYIVHYSLLLLGLLLSQFMYWYVNIVHKIYKLNVTFYSS